MTRTPAKRPRVDESGELPKLARRRGRPPIISNDALLAVAREVFLERGIRATTGEVAERAGVAEGTLFNRFGSKDALFRAAMRVSPEAIPAPLADIEARAGEGDLRATLLEVATGMLAVGRVMLPLMMMAWSNPTSDYSLHKVIDNKPAGYKRAFAHLRAFFEKEIALGRLSGACRPEVLTRVFMGSLHHYCMTTLFQPQDSAQAIPPDEFVIGLVDLLLVGAQADRAP